MTVMGFKSSAVKKRSVVIQHHKTSLSLEDEFWESLKTIAQARQTTVANLIREIEGDRGQGNLSSAIRLFVLGYYRGSSTTKQDMRMRGQARSRTGA
jgi:predicted DNA-binding ribbon-helix-helix protein